jgi:predicted nicotinamide N-methyase
VLLAQWQAAEPELVDLIALIQEGSGSGWQSIAAMWAGVGIYSWLRTKIKLKG